MNAEHSARKRFPATEFDKGHHAYFSSAIVQFLFSEVLDPALPPEIQPYSFVTSDILHHARAELALERGGVLVDLGCGTGGLGLWLATQTLARLVGIDRSRVAIQFARYRADRFALGRVPEFVVGDLAAVPVRDRSADAATCFDAIQFLADPTPAYLEVGRLLKAGGRVVVSTWLPVDRADSRLPPRLRVYQPDSMAAAGLEVVNVQYDSHWDEAEMRVAEAVCAMPYRSIAGDEAARRVRAEAVDTIRLRGATRRALITAVATGHGSSPGDAG